MDEDEFRTSAPRIFFDANDVLWFVMLREIDDLHEVHARSYDPASKKWGTEIRLDSGKGDASSLILDARSPGGAVVAWRDSSVTDEVSLYAAGYSSDAAGWGKAELLATLGYRDYFRGLTVAASPNGGGIAIWGVQTNENYIDASLTKTIVHSKLTARTTDAKTWGAESVIWKDDKDMGSIGIIPNDSLSLVAEKPVFTDGENAIAFFTQSGALSASSSSSSGWSKPIALTES